MKQHIFFRLAIVTILLFHVNLSTDREALLYVTPSSGVPCPANTCITLSHFAQTVSNWLSSNITLIFLNGNHKLDLDLFISNISNFSMLTNSTSESEGPAYTICCQHQVSLNFENVTKLWIKGIYFIGCGNNSFTSVSNFMISNSTFQGQNGSRTALIIAESNLIVTNSFFVSNRVGNDKDIVDINTLSNIVIHVGGAIFVAKSDVTIIRCTFFNNSADVGGAIYSTNYALNNISISNSTFIYNQVPFYDSNQSIYNVGKIRLSAGGAIATFNTILSINSSTFTNNTSDTGQGGALSIQQNSTMTVYNTKFYGNKANSYGGSIYVRESNVSIDNSIFLQNQATQGGAMYLTQGSRSVVILRRTIYKENSAKQAGGAIFMDERTQMYDNHSLFVHNRATNGGALYVISSEVDLNDSVLSHNQARESGGAIYILQSQQEIAFSGRCNLTHNSAGIAGGAIYAIESTLLLHGGDILDTKIFYVLTVAYNEDNDSGGGIYLAHSTFVSHDLKLGSIANILSNKAKHKGGGVCATNSFITWSEPYRAAINSPHQNLLLFTNNCAQLGGALFLTSAAQLRIQKTGSHLSSYNNALNTSIYFASNFAQNGTAIYVDDEMYPDVCDGSYNTKTGRDNNSSQCFFQVYSRTSALGKNSKLPNIEFTMKHSGNNSASSVIFGGLLDRCIPDPRRAEIVTSGYVHKKIDGFTYLKLISNIADPEMLTSLPVRVCFCTLDDKPNCSYKPPIIYKMKGEMFNVSLVAVDHMNHTIAQVAIHSYLKHTRSSLGEGQSLQVTQDACTNLTFSIRSHNHYEELILYPEGPCRNANGSLSRVRVNFTRCWCPIGFQNKQSRDDCICVCDVRLSPYFTEAANNCNRKTGSLIREGNFWIDFINGTNGSSGFLKHPYCPLDYCLPPTSKVYINLNLANGSDAQCANNRSGLLCSLCQPDLSLSLGSSRCVPCSKMQYKGYLPVILIALIAGIFLVSFLMFLNLTVANGTLNGLIFYMNIIGANSSQFFFGLSPSLRYYSILVSWLNLEIGFDICFFEGMDTYWKTWLQLAFPMYIMILVVLVIIVSEKSMRFSRLIGKANPVATLATLILLSYTKFLQTTITSLSFTQLDNPGGGSPKRVWLPDATVEYLSSKHIPLFVVAILILVIGTVYTCTIFFWQWLLHLQDKIMFKWVISQQLCHFIEPYHAPYVPKHRYWTGLLLFIRFALYLVFALNVSGDPGVNLLAIITSVVGLFIIKGQFGRVYQSVFVDVIEVACYANLGVLSTIKLKFEDTRIVGIASHISGAFTVILLAVIISYHLYAIVCTKYSKRRTNEQQLNETATVNYSTARGSTSNDIGKPTFSALYLGPPDSVRQNSARVEISTNYDEDDRASLASTDSTSPLLDYHH